MRFRVLLVAVVALLAACGGDSEGGGYSTPEDLAVALGCEHQADTTEEIFVHEIGRCDFDDEDVRLITFGNSEGREGFVQAARSFGAILVYGDKWAVQVEDQDTADAVKEKVGGTVS